MKRIFADLHLCLNMKDTVAAKRVIDKLATLGYGLIGVCFSPETRETECAGLRSVCTSMGIDFASRVDLRPRTREHLVNQLRRLRRKFEVVSVLCESKEVARQAAKDRRVDLLSFPSIDYKRRFFDRAEAELACNSLAALEVDVKPLLVLEGPTRVRFLSTLRREVAVAKEFQVPVVVSSGVSNDMLLRKPRELAAVGALFGLDEVSGLIAVSANPVAIVRRNRAKLSRGFVAPGIRVIKEGRDCEAS
jgi:ribonuclease P/MRP protein subunit RPP1